MQVLCCCLAACTLLPVPCDIVPLTYAIMQVLCCWLAACTLLPVPPFHQAAAETQGSPSMIVHYTVLISKISVVFTSVF